MGAPPSEAPQATQYTLRGAAHDPEGVADAEGGTAQDPEGVDGAEGGAAHDPEGIDGAGGGTAHDPEGVADAEGGAAQDPEGAAGAEGGTAHDPEGVDGAGGGAAAPVGAPHALQKREPTSSACPHGTHDSGAAAPQRPQNREVGASGDWQAAQQRADGDRSLKTHPRSSTGTTRWCARAPRASTRVADTPAPPVRGCDRRSAAAGPTAC